MREEAASLQLEEAGPQEVGVALFFEMRGSLKVLWSQVEKDLGKRRQPKVTTSSTAERNCARVPSTPVQAWAFALGLWGPPQPRVTAGTCVRQHLWGRPDSRHLGPPSLGACGCLCSWLTSAPSLTLQPTQPFPCPPAGGGPGGNPVTCLRRGEGISWPLMESIPFIP